MNKRKKVILITLCLIVAISFASTIYHKKFVDLVDSQTLLLLQDELDNPNFIDVLTAHGYEPFSDGTSYHKQYFIKNDSSETILSILVETGDSFTDKLEYGQERKHHIIGGSLRYVNSAAIEYKQFRISILEITDNRNTDHIASKLQDLINSNQS